MKGDIWEDGMKEEKRRFYRRQRMLRIAYLIFGFLMGLLLGVYIMGWVN